MASYQGQTTAKSRTKVKPILRKLTQSEKNSLDLDRPAAEQDGLGIYDYGTGSRSSHDINFTAGMGRRGYHNRSTSGTSQFSTATTGSAPRTGSFVHPFQQTPRPYTPPLAASYQNSLRESEHSPSPALTEDDEPANALHPFRSASNLSNHRNPTSTTSTTSPVVSSSLSQQPLRIQTKQPSSSRQLATSHTNLSLHTHDLTSPSETPTMISPVSAIRTSMDKGFRIRSRSEVDSRSRAETIQEARRKFQEKELAKEEKAAREEIKALEKRNQKEARVLIERGHRRSSASDATRRKRSKSDLTMTEKGDSFLVGREYDSVTVQTPPAFGEFAGEGNMGARQREGALKETKKKTHSAWTKLMMWLRTRFIRMGSKRDRS